MATKLSASTQAKLSSLRKKQAARKAPTPTVAKPKTKAKVLPAPATRQIGGVTHIETKPGVFTAPSTPVDITTATEAANLRSQEMFDEDLFNTVEEQTADIKQREKTETSLLSQQIDRQRKQVALQRGAQIEQEERGISGAQVAFGGGREGAETTSQTAIPAAFERGVQTQRQIAQLQIQDMFAEQGALKTQLKEAQTARRQNLVSADIERERAIQLEIAASEERVAGLQAAQEGETLKKQERLFDILQSMPAQSIAVMEDQTVASLFDQAGISPSLGFAFKYGQTQVAEAEQKKDQIAFAQAQANLAKTLRDIQGEATNNLTTDQKNFMFAQQLEGDARTKFEAFAGITKDSSLQSIKVGEDVYTFNAKTGATEKVVDSSGNNNLMPTGQIATAVFNSKPVTLDSAALASLSNVNGALVKAGFGEFDTGAISSSSFRDNQASVIAQIAQRTNIGFNEVNPNETAQQLRDLGIAVANVGGSMHEKGLAVDVFPNQEYIAQIKPFMEKNGWTQPIPGADAGHFEFTGVVATEPEIALGTKEQFTFERELKKDFEGFAKEPRQALQQIDIIRKAFALAKVKQASGGSINAVSQGILVPFQKMLDPTSVVRESEYARSGQGLSLIGQAKGQFERLLVGGAGVTVDDLEEFVDTAEEFMKGYEDSLVNFATRTKVQIKRFGLNEDAILTPDIQKLINRKEQTTVDEAFDFISQGASSLVTEEEVGLLDNIFSE